MVDDRGHEVEVLRRGGFEPWPIKEDPRILLLIRRVNIAAGGEKQIRQTLLVVGAALLSMVIFFVGMGLARVYARGTPMWIAPVCGIVVVQGIAIGLTRGSRRWTEPRIVSEVLKEGLCPSCGYNLHGIPVAEDGCVVCPECGSAWKGERIRRTEEFMAKAACVSPLRAIQGQARNTSWTTRDARGVKVELAHPRLRKAIRASGEERAARLREARRETARGSRWLRWPALGIAWGATIAGLVMLAIYSPGWAEFGMTFVALVAICLVMTFSNVLYSGRAMRRAMTGRRMCPSCTRELGEARDAEGVVWCRGCLGDWKVG